MYDEEDLTLTRAFMNISMQSIFISDYIQILYKFLYRYGP